MRQLADVASVEAGSSVIAAAHVSYHCMWRRALRAASELGGPDRPSEPMASPCWLLMQVGFNLRQLFESGPLLQDCNSTSTIAEQWHGSFAALKRARPQCHEDTLVARAQVLATRRLVPKPTEDEQWLVRAMKKEAQLAQNMPDRIKGRQAYVVLRWHATRDPRMLMTRAR